MKRFNPVYIILIIAVVTAIGSYFLFFKTSEDEVKKVILTEEEFESAYNEAWSYSQNEELEKSVESFEKLLPSVSDPDEKARIKLIIASDALGFDPLKGFNIYKSIVSDEKVSGLYRALATQFIADAFMLRRQNPNYALQYIFNDEPYKSLFKEVPLGGVYQVHAGIKSIYENSLIYYDHLPISYYRIAEWYSLLYLISEAGVNKTPLDSGEMLKNVREFTNNGDKAIAEYLDLFRTTQPTQVAYALWMKGRLHGFLAQHDKGVLHEEIAETSFMQALSSLKTGTHWREHAMRPWVDFYYASYLVRMYDDGRQEDINLLLQDLLDTVQPPHDVVGFTKYVQYTMSFFNLEPNALLLLRQKEINEITPINQSFNEYVREIQTSPPL